jgi:hypothetical protein
MVASSSKGRLHRPLASIGSESAVAEVEGVVFPG